MPFLIIFNFGAAILRSIGDTKRPFFALIAAGIVNVALNLFFVIILGMGVAGVAWGTVISTAVNAAIIVAILVREKSDIKLDFSNLRTGFSEIGKICRVGLPAGLQSTIFAFSNVFVLSAINTFGSFAVAGSATAINYEFYCYFVINAIGQTAVAFASQNYGAGQYDRVKRIFRLSILLSVGLSAFLNILIAWQGEFFLSAFTQDPQVLVYALQRIHYVLLFQWIACYYEMAGQIMRALGRSMTPALITIFGTCVVRLIWVAYFPANAPFYRLMTVYPVTWTLTSILMAVAFSALSRRMLNEKSVENTTKIGYIEENA